MIQGVSVIVPTHNSARTIDSCLRSLRRQSFPCKVIVVDNSSTDETIALAGRLADVVIRGGPERSAQRNLGASVAPARVVGFIDSDMVLDIAVVEQAEAAIAAGAGAVIVPERSVGTGFWAKVRTFERSFYEGSDAMEAARFFHWDVFRATGGFDERLTGPEDWDLTERARAFGPIVRITAVIDHDEGSPRYLDACRKKATYAEGLYRYTRLRGLGTLATHVHRPWIRTPKRLVSVLGVALIALKVGELIAVMSALARSRIRAIRRMDDNRRGVPR